MAKSSHGRPVKALMALRSRGALMALRPRGALMALGSRALIGKDLGPWLGKVNPRRPRWRRGASDWLGVCVGAPGRRGCGASFGC